MKDNYITVAVHGCVRKVTLDEIVYLARDGRKLRLMTDMGEIEFYEKLENVLHVLDERFYPCLKGCYVNLEKISCMDEQQMFFENGASYALGRENFVRTKQKYYHFLKANERREKKSTDLRRFWI